jgi:hypothetical protein
VELHVFDSIYLAEQKVLLNCVGGVLNIKFLWFAHIGIQESEKSMNLLFVSDDEFIVLFNVYFHPFILVVEGNEVDDLLIQYNPISTLDYEHTLNLLLKLLFLLVLYLLSPSPSFQEEYYHLLILLISRLQGLFNGIVYFLFSIYLEFFNKVFYL